MSKKKALLLTSSPIPDETVLTDLEQEILDTVETTILKEDVVTVENNVAALETLQKLVGKISQKPEVPEGNPKMRSLATTSSALTSDKSSSKQFDAVITFFILSLIIF